MLFKESIILSILFFYLFLSNCINAQIVRIDNTSVSDSLKWQNSADVNLQTVKNTTQFFRLAIGSHLKFRQNDNTFLSLNELRYIIAGRKGLENRGFQHVRYQRKLDTSYTLELFSQIQFDEVLKVQLRQLNGIGLRTQFLRKTNNQFFFGTLYMYEYEEEIGTSIINRDHRISTYITALREIDKSSIHIVLYYQPKIIQLSDFRISGSITFSVELVKRLSFNMRGDIAYDSNPVIQVPNLIYSFMNGFSWNL